MGMVMIPMGVDDIDVLVCVVFHLQIVHLTCLFYSTVICADTNCTCSSVRRCLFVCTA